MLLLFWREMEITWLGIQQLLKDTYVVTFWWKGKGMHGYIEKIKSKVHECKETQVLFWK